MEEATTLIRAQHTFPSNINITLCCYHSPDASWITNNNNSTSKAVHAHSALSDNVCCSIVKGIVVL